MSDFLSVKLPDEMWDKVASELSIRGLVALSMGNRQLRRVMREHRPTDNTPIFTDQVGVREVWPYLPFVMKYPQEDEVNSVFVSGDYLYTACGDGIVKKIDINTGETLMEYPHEDWVNSVFVSGDYLYTGCSDGSVRRFHL